MSQVAAAAGFYMYTTLCIKQSKWGMSGVKAAKEGNICRLIERLRPRH